MIRISISNNLNKINIVVDYALKYSSRLQEELLKRYIFKGSFYLFLSPLYLISVRR
jgi:hypothetical protein